MRFSTIQGQPIPDVVSYIKDWMAQRNQELNFFPDDEMKLYVATDSQNRGNKTLYASVIVIYRVGKGGHVILWREYVNRIHDMERKLRLEGYRTMEIAQKIMDEDPDLGKLIIVHFDFNSDAQFPSYKLTNEFVGWAKGIGLRAEIKPLSYVAMHVADNFVQSHKQ